GKLPHAGHSIRDPLVHSFADQSLDRLTCHEHAALRFEERPLHVVERELWKAFPEIRPRQFLERNVELLQHRDVEGGVGVSLTLQPENSRRIEELSPDAAKESLP